jgi:L-aminopeptidase/D-esterase-like protein
LIGLVANTISVRASHFRCDAWLLCAHSHSPISKREDRLKRLVTPVALCLGAIVGLSACTNPYDPGQRAAGGALIGAGAGAALGGLAGGGRGAATGALIGGAVGATEGVATTPPPPGYYQPGYYPPPPPRYYGRPGYYEPGYYPPPGY